MNSEMQRAIEVYRTQQALAKALGVSQQTVSNWLNSDDGVPKQAALRIAEAIPGIDPIRLMFPNGMAA